MSVTSALGNQAKLLWQFLGFFQKPYLRFLHAIIAVLVILQILSSFAMHMLSSGQLNPALSSWLASWYHILSGLLVVILSLLLAAEATIICLVLAFTIFSRTSGVIRNSSKRTFRPACASRWFRRARKGWQPPCRGSGSARCCSSY